ncbi:bacteriocin-like protein [Aquimarina sp. EL_43]|uniref:bacteriocin n=1 Tax=unclassified Aquimarina TaxID=2627091 RepID=UPI0018CBB257|nr:MULTISPECIES: bacteriocin [unclassified Aquimarina]MBG6132000.1 bacteriocin-like protein [Aquimarina sp. EL_35]MBG6149564.1 bacteriocin-like protein [Aquimarina sp. EL_32]MBG6170173.1 bacteriocin-like protein [Aquimarina sp. EL_43]
MKNSKSFEALNNDQLNTINGGLVIPNLGDLDTFPIVPFGDPREWDNYFPKKETSSF